MREGGRVRDPDVPFCDKQRGSSAGQARVTGKKLDRRALVHCSCCRAAWNDCAPPEISRRGFASPACPPKMRAERNRTRPSFGSSRCAPSRRLRSGVVRQLAEFPGWLIAAAAFGDSAIRAYAEPDRPKNGSARVRKCELPDKAVVRFGFYLETASCGTVEICPGHAIDRGTLERAHRSIQSHPGKFFDVIAWVVRIADAASCLTAPACRAARASACDATCRIMHPS